MFKKYIFHVGVKDYRDHPPGMIKNALDHMRDLVYKSGFLPEGRVIFLPNGDSNKSSIETIETDW